MIFPIVIPLYCCTYISVPVETSKHFTCTDLTSEILLTKFPDNYTALIRKSHCKRLAVL